MTLEDWLSKRSYLRPVAEFHAQVAEASANIPMTPPPIPDWSSYANSYCNGLPLLRSYHAVIYRAEVERATVSLIEKLTAMPLPGKLKSECVDLNEQLHGNPDTPRRGLTWLLGNDSCRVCIRACSVISAGPYWLVIYNRWLGLSRLGAIRMSGCGIIALFVDPAPLWLSS